MCEHFLCIRFHVLNYLRKTLKSYFLTSYWQFSFFSDHQSFIVLSRELKVNLFTKLTNCALTDTNIFFSSWWCSQTVFWYYYCPASFLILMNNGTRDAHFPTRNRETGNSDREISRREMGFFPGNFPNLTKFGPNLPKKGQNWSNIDQLNIIH